MEFLILLALIGVAYLVYLIRQDLKDHSVRIESQMQRITEVVVNLEDKDSEKYIIFISKRFVFGF